MRPAQRLLVPLGVVAFLAFSAGSAFGASPAALWHMNETTGTTMGDAWATATPGRSRTSGSASPASAVRRATDSTARRRSRSSRIRRL